MRVEDDLAFRNKHSSDRKSLGVKKPYFKPKSIGRSEPTRQISNVRFEKKGPTTSKSDQYPKISSYGFPGSSKDVVTSLKQLQQNVRWPKKSDKNSDKKDKTKWCDFHSDFGHITNDCIALKKELSWLNSKGYLQELTGKKDVRPTSPKHAKVINCITGGSDVCGTTYSAAKRHASRGPDDRPIPKEARLKEGAELEAMPLTILVDGGSSANIIFFDAVKAMGIDKSEITRRSTTLVGFNGGATSTMGEITLPVYAKGINRQMKFNVVDCSSAYNVILGRPWIHDMKAVPSTYHQSLKFPTQWGVQEIKGERKVARECYKVSLKPPKQTDHNDCCAWMHEDMVGIDPSIISHKLNVDPSFKPVQQKRRKFAPERNKVINDEVDNLLKTGKIREVKYPDWLANVVVVQKKNGKWRVCIDFTDLNKACPKDPFPLPHIDSMVDATAGHELLTFMDAYSGYNQILMHPDDQEKTTFMTDKGIYCYKVMPFGLKNAGSTYQRLVNMMFKEHLGDTMEVYIDDMLVKSKYTDDHIGHLKQSFDILREYKMKLNPTKCSFGVRAGKFLGSSLGRPTNVTYSTTSCEKNKGFEWNDKHEEALQQLKKYMTSPPFLSKPEKGEALQLYLAVSINSVSAVLIRETDGQQLPIYYVSKTLLDAETRYSSIEKLLLSLVMAAKKLRHYFESHAITVVTNFPLKSVLRKPERTGRLAKWSIYLSNYDMDFKPKTAIKLQSPQGGKIVYSIRCDFKATNNEAKYEVLIAGMKIAHDLGATCLHVRSDSSLVVNQVNGEFAAKDSKMIAYYKIVKEEAKKFSRFIVEQVPRDQNTQADVLANLGSTLNQTTFDNIPIVHLTTPSIKDDGNILVAPIEEENSWSDDIKNYLENDQLPDDRMEARKVRFKASRKSQSSQPDITTRLLLADIKARCDQVCTVVRRMSKTHRFGIPSEITCDNGTQFISDRTRRFCEERNIKLVTSTPRYPQSNGLAESSNKTIINSIKKRLKAAKGKWVEELPSVLWANRTTYRTSTGQTPFSLVYGCEAVLPIEVRLPTSRHTSVEHNLVDLSYDLDALEELREAAHIHMVAQKQVVERHFNKNVQIKVFQEGDYVLRRVFQNTQEVNAGKLSTKWEGPYQISSIVGKGTYKIQTLDDRDIPRSWNAVHLKSRSSITFSALRTSALYEESSI
ncbi:hypothetical protein L6452_20892 [Arctium lappa]|uniref:Uncharacterized protein n=1 Tax=Arctium lappa TaxID=4217 RepID=A0ACB9BDF5_ARCLA|nr:hypothetical protein L6452_20892 [Arctium lappa]